MGIPCTSFLQLFENYKNECANEFIQFFVNKDLHCENFSSFSHRGLALHTYCPASRVYT